ncbi:MAG: FHA domain-containing protein [Vulcanimicrobiota bacterium]
MNPINQFNGVSYRSPVRQPVAAELKPAAASPVQQQESLGLSGVPRGVCFMPDGQAVYLPKPGGQMVLGRDSKCDKVISDGEVSRNHARVAEKDGKYYLQDMGSTNGTYLNGKRLEPSKWVEFNPGDVLRLGQNLEINRSPHDLPEQLPELKLPSNNQALTIGRAPENSIQTPWADASRSHAVIQNKDGVNWIWDKGSSNGTLINGKKIPSQQWVVLQPGAKVQFGYSPEGAFNVAGGGPPVQSQFQAAAQPVAQRSLATEIRALSGPQAEAVFSKARFLDNPVGVRARGAADCTKEFLQAQGLEPKTTFQCGDTKVHFSRPYSLGDNRAACVGYVEDKNGNVSIRAFYRSNSQGLWRSASHAGFNGWIGKGQGEESTNLPIQLQMALHSQADHQVKSVSKQVAEQAFYGSLPVGGNEPPGDLAAQLKPAQTLGDFDRKLPDGYGQPESFHFQNPADAPDFRKPGVSYSFDHPLHGRVGAHCFTSQNGECNYMFYQDSKGRSWLAQMERADSPLTSWGTRSNPIEHGDLGMPAVEYYQQIPKGYLGGSVDDSYGDASRYVHRLPVVADFRRSLGLG